MKQAFIHIGAPGAGTERIQTLLQDHEKFLRQHGCVCPRAGRSRPAAANHHNLGFELLGDRRFHPEAGGIGALIDELAKRAAAKVVLSSNLFISLGSRPGLIDSLRQAFIGQGYQVSWIVYLRPYAEWLESVYIERVRSRQTSAGFDKWLEENHNHQIAAPARMLRFFFATGDRVIVRSHSLAADHLAADFLDQIEIPHPEDLVDANPARQVLAMELTRLIDEFSDLHRDDEGRARLLAKARLGEADLPPSPPYRVLSHETASRLKEETRESYEQVLALASMPLTYAEFFPAREVYGKQDFDNIEWPAETLAAFYKVMLACALA